MFEWFERKIEEIRQKPEDARRRYVWAMVAISMFFVVTIWFYSIKSDSLKQEEEQKAKDKPQSNFAQSYREQKASIDDALKNIRGSLDTVKEQGQALEQLSPDGGSGSSEIPLTSPQ